MDIRFNRKCRFRQVDSFEITACLAILRRGEAIHTIGLGPMLMFLYMASVSLFNNLSIVELTCIDSARCSESGIGIVRGGIHGTK